MKRFAQLTFVACLAIASLAASFPYVTLNNKTNRLSDNGSALTFNGSALGSGSITTNAPAIAAGSPAVFVSSNLLGAATSAQLQSALGIVSLTLTHAGTVTLTNTSLSVRAYMDATGSVTFATSDLTFGHDYLLFCRNTQSTNITLSYPQNGGTNAWHFPGGATTTVPALSSFTMSMTSFGTVDTNVVASCVLNQ